MDFSTWEVPTGRLVLKVLNESYAGKALDFYIRNNEFHKQWSPLRETEFYTLGFQSELLKGELDRINRGEMFRTWIFSRGDTDFERPIGFIALNNIVRGCFHSCFVGYNMDKDEINKGYITEALNSIVKFAFNELKLHRLEANIRPTNGPSLKVAEKLGFYNEGLAKKYLKINGMWEDHIHMVLLNKDLE